MTNEMDYYWAAFCEPESNASSTNSSITRCTQQVFINLPTFSLLAILSSYNFGCLYDSIIIRNRTQIISLNLRAFVVFLLSVLPLGQFLYKIRLGIKLWPVDVLLACDEILCWAIHFGNKIT